MHFTRNNFANSSQNESSTDQHPQEQPVRENRPVTATRPPEVPLDQAPWQAAFKLAPNVRFTRTPESAIPKRPRSEPAPLAPEERKPAAQSRLVEPLEMNNPDGRAETLAPELLVNALQGQRRPCSSRLPTSSRQRRRCARSLRRAL